MMRFKGSSVDFRLVACALAVGAALPAFAAPKPTPTGAVKPHIVSVKEVPDLAGSPSARAALLRQYGNTPNSIRQAYNFDRLKNKGAGQTIAIVDVYASSASTVQADLDYFSSVFSLPRTTVTVLEAPKASPDPAVEPETDREKRRHDLDTPEEHAGWRGETSLDVQWVHAIAPEASIVLVLASSPIFADIAVAEKIAVENAPILSMSYGAPEEDLFDTQESVDSYCKLYHDHPDHVFSVASGDSGNGAQYPAVCPGALAVGGTYLSLTQKQETSEDGTSGISYDVYQETAWKFGGGGASRYVSIPAYQAAAGIKGKKRVVPDLAYNSDPRSGFYVYIQKDKVDGQGHPIPSLYVYGGTSAAAPQIAAMIALLRSSGGAPEFGSHEDFYRLAAPRSVNYVDIRKGCNGLDPTDCSRVGFDETTGIGRPRPDRILASFNKDGLVDPLATVPIYESYLTVPTSALNGGFATVHVYTRRPASAPYKRTGIPFLLYDIPSFPGATPLYSCLRPAPTFGVQATVQYLSSVCRRGDTPGGVLGFLDSQGEIAGNPETLYGFAGVVQGGFGDAGYLYRTNRKAPVHFEFLKALGSVPAK